MLKYPMTKNSYEKIQKELNSLQRIERIKIIHEIKLAREHGDLSENAEYHAAKEKQSFIEAKITSLKNMFHNAEIIDTKSTQFNKNKIQFGATITLLDKKSNKKKIYKIVGEYESDLKNGLISINSPLIKVILGKQKLYSFEFSTSKGTKSYTILDIKY